VSQMTDRSIEQSLRNAIPGNDPAALREAAIAAIRDADDLTVRLRAIAAAAARIKAKSFTVEGEAVVLAPDDLSSCADRRPHVPPSSSSAGAKFGRLASAGNRHAHRSSELFAAQKILDCRIFGETW
jgi:hypothetical protein